MTLQEVIKTLPPTFYFQMQSDGLLHIFNNGESVAYWRLDGEQSIETIYFLTKKSWMQS